VKFDEVAENVARIAANFPRLGWRIVACENCAGRGYTKRILFWHNRCPVCKGGRKLVKYGGEA
jgi:DnaJ-class molecular chaperone